MTSEAMTLFERIRHWFRSESTEAREWSADLQRDLSADLDRKEADLQATPAERMERLQEQISGNTEAIDEIRGRVEASGIESDAVDVADAGDDEINR